MKILLIDDSRSMRAIQKAVLTQMGHTEFQEARDGAEGLSMVDSFRPDLILVDSTMPRLDGLAFVRQLRAKGFAQPVLMVAPVASKAHITEAFKAGVTAYLAKPFTPDLLQQRIEESLQRYHSARAA